MKKYKDVTDLFSAVAYDENLKNELLSCQTIDDMYNFVSKFCSNKFSKNEFKDFINKIIKNYLLSEKMSDNKLQKVTGGNLGQKLLEAANYVTGDLFKFEENAGEDAEPVPQHRAIASIAKFTSSALVTVPNLYNAICNFSKQWSNSKKKKQLRAYQDELEDLNFEIEQLKKQKL